MLPLPARQVHLDFHTSEFIPGVGAEFNKSNFQQALLLGHVNSITVFAKCHHSWSYYPTKIGRMHPALKFDLLGSMINAAHEVGVKAPIYVTVGWSANDAADHPDWLTRDKNGIETIGLEQSEKLDARADEKMPTVCWKRLCINTGYEGYVYGIVKEICEMYEANDGLFFDMCCPVTPCYCDKCKEDMRKLGLNPQSDNDEKQFRTLVWQRFMTNCTLILREKHKTAPIFFNGGANMYQPQWHEWQTHYEMEDLPTTWGGYDKMPLHANYFSRTGKQYLGMTGKFHTMWGEFGGFKTPKALKYECAIMLAYGARCSVGDQLHPSALMDMETYRTIGHAYEYVEKIEPYCFDSLETARLGIFLSENKKSNEGLVKMLLEANKDFVVAKPEDEFEDKYDVLILADDVLLDDEVAAKIGEFVQRGRGVLLTGESGLDEQKKYFLLDIGAKQISPSSYDNDYVRVGEAIRQDLVESPILFYEGANRVKVIDAEVLAAIKEPYFNRTYKNYCSHQNTPYKLEDADYPGAVRKGNVVYMAHKVCRIYQEHGAQYHRDYFINALNSIYKTPVLDICLPSSGRSRLAKQSEKNRYILHVLYASPVQRGRTSVIEDTPPVYRIKVKIRLNETVKRVYLAPQNIDIGYQRDQGTVRFVVPELNVHQIVVIDYI